MSGYTDGPWEVSRDPFARGFRRGIFRRRPNGRRYDIARIISDPNSTVIPEANAHLIAAAPDLLDALWRLADAVEALEETPPILTEGAMSQAREAIAKAEGS